MDGEDVTVDELLLNLKTELLPMMEEDSLQPKEISINELFLESLESEIIVKVEDDGLGLSEYEKIQQDNIAERALLFNSLLDSVDEQPSTEPKRKIRSSLPQNARVLCVSTRSFDMVLRNRTVTPPSRKYHWKHPELGDEIASVPKKRKSCCVGRRASVHRSDKAGLPNTNYMKVEDVTQGMLRNIVVRFVDKVLDPVYGTSCHQCRQKTLDTKSICRSSSCFGIRGQFCGRCLQLRYGEDLYVVLMNPTWECPPCRGVCNCSICRCRNGRAPTGQLASIATECGYSSVQQYLKLERKELDLEEDTRVSNIT